MSNLPSTVTVNLKPYVKHWLVSNFGHPVQFPRKSAIGKVFLNCMSKRFHEGREKHVRQLTAAVEFKMNYNDLIVHGVELQKQLEHHVNDYFEDKIKIQLFKFIDAQRTAGMKVNDAIKLYQKRMGFIGEKDGKVVELFTFEAIHRAYYVKRNEYIELSCQTVINTSTLFD